MVTHCTRDNCLALEGESELTFVTIAKSIVIKHINHHLTTSHFHINYIHTYVPNAQCQSSTFDITEIKQWPDSSLNNAATLFVIQLHSLVELINFMFVRSSNNFILLYKPISDTLIAVHTFNTTHVSLSSTNRRDQVVKHCFLIG